MMPRTLRRPARRPALRRGQQAAFVFPTWGGKRAGAGRKPKGERAMVSHLRRPEHRGRHPVLVTVKLLPVAPTFRGKTLVHAVRRALAAGAERLGMRLVEYVIERDHLHLIVEAEDRRALARGMQGLSVRVARTVNKTLGRRGRVLADRYHARALRTPSEVRGGLGYVLNNERRHAFKRGELLPREWVDPFSSAPHFDGYKPLAAAPPAERWAIGPPITARPRTWLLRTGWRLRGLLDREAVTRPAPFPSP
jgi:REP element-mobilizing transposase RayT